MENKRMKIYDRYYGDPTSERNRYMKEEGNARFSALMQNKIGIGIILACLAALEIFLACRGDFDSDIGMIMVCIPILAIMMVWWFRRLRRKCDAWIYGMKDGKFLMLNTVYETIRRIAPGDVREIRILPACRPDTRTIRTRYEKSGYESITWFKPVLEPQKRENHAGFTYYPMAVLYTGKAHMDWNRYEDATLFRLQDAGFHELLQKQLVIVPHGENREPFVYLLQNSTCLVIISARMYGLHREMMDQMFIQSGMDMSRLVIEEE